MFIDRARLVVRGGGGGRGIISFRREAHVPRGGPDGGDGGHGGSVILRVDSGMTTLSDFRFRTTLEAASGAAGGGKNKSGKAGADLVVRVPEGTIVVDREPVVADIPGLIEGAHTGAGLGEEFLRHIERTRLIVHVVDLALEDPIADIATVDTELTAYGRGLMDRPRLFALNKLDLFEAN